MPDATDRRNANELAGCALAPAAAAKRVPRLPPLPLNAVRAKRPSSTRINTPPDADMRAVRQDSWAREQARRVALASDPEAEKVARDLANDPRAQRMAPFFSVFDTEREADTAAYDIRSALNSIIDANNRRPRKGPPRQASKLLAAFDALHAAGIPVRVGNKFTSKAEQHLMDTFGCKLSEARGAVRRLMNLRSRLGD